MGNTQNKKHLENHHEHATDEKKHGNDRELPTIPHNPFDITKQQKVTMLFDETIKPSQDTGLTSAQLVQWISDYLKEEDYDTTEAILDDLNDPQFSHLKESMENQWQNEANQSTVDAIYTMLKEDIFSDDGNISHRTSIYEYSTSNDIDPGGPPLIHNNQSMVVHDDIPQLDRNEPDQLEDQIMLDAPFNVYRQKSQEVKVQEDQYTANREPFPEFINIALFGRSDDEYLEMLIDKALLKVCYSKSCEELWNDETFIANIYNNNKFPDAVDKVYSKINHEDDTNDLDFIGNFVRKEFKRQINENKRKIEEKAREETEHQQHDPFSTDVDDMKGTEFYYVSYDQDEHRYNVVSRDRNARAPNHVLCTLAIAEIPEEDNDYCWAVFKKKKFKNNYSISTKGYWEVITEQKDKEREDKRRKFEAEEKEKAERAARAKAAFERGRSDSLNFLKKTRSAVSGFLSTRSVPDIPGEETKYDDAYGNARLGTPKKKSFEIHTPAALSTLNDGVEEDVIESPKIPKPKKPKKFEYISLLHLNIIFELLQFHYMLSIKESKERQSIAGRHKRLAASPLYIDHCAVQEFADKRDTMHRRDHTYDICIDDKVTFKLEWCNFKGRSECNSFYFSLPECDKPNKKYSYLRYRHNYEKVLENGTHELRMIWDWYDNDDARYRKYKEGFNNEIYKELEASFQSNVDVNFPNDRFGTTNANDNTTERPFNVCILPQLKDFLEKDKGIHMKCLVLRFTFTDKTNRIMNIEQVSLRDTGSFPRNVRRLLDMKNSLNFYWQNTNKFIEEWKHRYLLSTKPQQLYFWSYILCIATIMKYIEIELAHQLISIPFERDPIKQDVEYTGLDDSDLQRHKIDCQLWNGFFMPPQNQLQTAQISRHMDGTDSFDDWYEGLSRVEPLTKFINDTRRSRTSKSMLQKSKAVACGHSVSKGDVLWYSEQTYDIYCNRCATLLQFSECIRKYVLESESSEVIDFMWPWYRNYSHRNDRKKYLKYIAKYNLSHLFMVRDVVDKHNGEEDTDKDGSETPPSCCRRVFCCDRCKQDKYDDEYLDALMDAPLLIESNKRLESQNTDKENARLQIRHLRKFAASVLLQPWDILRNLNVIKSQLQLLFKSNKFSASKTKGMHKWDTWKKKIDKINGKAQNAISDSDRTTILELRHDAEFNLSDDEQNILHDLVKIILQEFEIEDAEPMDNDDQKRYYTSFKASFRMVPEWWVIEHDILLIELGLKFNWNRDEINDELTDPSKKYYYQELLKTQEVSKDNNQMREMDEMDTFSDGVILDDGEFKEEEKETNDDDDRVDEHFEYRGYQEFQVWCSDWRNIQHRLRFLSFTVCKYLSECRPSIIHVRIPNSADRTDQYKTSSFIFLNGYIETVHLANCSTQRKYLDNLVQQHKKVRSLGDVLSPALLHRAQSSRVISIAQNTARMRDPFMTRHLDFELQQLCQAFDLLSHGVDIALFLIKLLARKQSDSLWSCLGIVLEHMPYEAARYVLSEEREDLRHGEPQQLKHVCDQIIKGSNFSVHICLFLAEYMEQNAAQDLARFKKWMQFSEYYEEEAGHSINEIESDHLLSVLMDIPLSESGDLKVPLLQVALEQNRAQFLNNERINAVLKHVWQTPSGLDPNVNIVRKSRTSQQILYLLLDSPFHFYLTPMGFNSTIKSLHLLYVLSLYVFIYHRIYLWHALRRGEVVLWTLNIGYFVYEVIEAYDKGVRDYFTLAGWVNYWDLQISFTWLALCAIRISSVWIDYRHEEHIALEGDEAHDEAEAYHLDIPQIYLVLWAIQIASLSGRSLVLFQTSSYFGVLLRMMQRLIIEMMKFMFVLFLILTGFVFGLYYIEGGYASSSYDEFGGGEIHDWYEGFKYLFQLTVGAGDFNGTHPIVDDEITAQLFTILYIIFATILMMNLLIALMTTTFEQVYSQARTESAFAMAETTYDLSHRSRFMPAPICIYIFAIAAIVHCLNLIPALIAPQTLNIYNYMNHYRYECLTRFKFSEMNCSNDRQRDEEDDVYKLSKRKRVCRYYCCSSDKYNLHHSGCYSCIPTELGAKDVNKDRSSCNGITLNQYAEEYESHFKFALDPQDTVLLKHLTVDTLFCKYCYRPFDPKNKKNLEDVLLTPFGALSELISIYLFPFTAWCPLLIVYAILAICEECGSIFNNDIQEAPNVADHDRQYFQKDTLNISSAKSSSSSAAANAPQQQQQLNNDVQNDVVI
eukprot:759378_1